MSGKLVIVESPHKAKQIQGYLGSDYTVKASQGHIRDLQEKSISIDIEHGFAPEYIVSPGKDRIVKELKSLSDKAETVLLASDPDREGEAIAWHLKEVLGLSEEKARRISYNEVTKTAIQEAIGNPRNIDMDLVKAQTARRVLDRLVGFELSPVLWRKVKRGLSAGRVQSVALRLVVDREREIAAFTPEASYRIEATFNAGGTKAKGLLDKKFPTIDEARDFLQKSIGAAYSVESVEKKEGVRYPAAPFTTSTLQQEAARRLHLPVGVTMRIAQGLYERGLITYMRTDSTNLSQLALGTAKKFITDQFGAEYSNPRQFKTKAKGAQEAHEAIRPTYIENTEIKGTAQEQKLYELIWKRTVASQMADAKVLNTSVKIASDKFAEKYSLQATEILFDGFLKLYMGEPEDEDAASEVSVLPVLVPSQKLECLGVTAECKYSQPPMRYSQATLVKKLEELEIGRPSTYSTIIDTLTRGRGYIVQGDKEGRKVKVENLSLNGSAIESHEKVEVLGAEKGKLLPQDVGLIVTDFLVENFPDVMDYDFTANVEKNFDRVAEGELEWNKLIADFYSPFHAKVEGTLTDGKFSHVSRELGVDPSDGLPVTAKFGQFGPYVQKGDGESRIYASLGKGQLIENITLEEALKLLQLPRNLGQYKGIDVIAQKGRFGPYIKYGDKNITLPRSLDPLKVTLEDCASLIDAQENQKQGSDILKEFKESDITVLNGRYGPYIKHAGSNYKIPKGTDAASLTEEACLGIINESKPTAGKYRKFRKK